MCSEVFSPAARKIRSQRSPRKTSVLFFIAFPYLNLIKSTSLLERTRFEAFIPLRVVWFIFIQLLSKKSSLSFCVNLVFGGKNGFVSCKNGERGRLSSFGSQCLYLVIQFFLWTKGGKDHSSLLRDASMQYIRGGLRAHWFYLIFFVSDKGSLNPR